MDSSGRCVEGMTGGVAGQTLADRLRGLRAADLEALLRRRPEAGGLDVGRASFADLAGTLSHPAGIDRAVGRLNRFLHQLLQLGCVEAGRLALDVAEAEGLTAGLVEEGGRELARWGLAFPDEDGGLAVPPEVRERVPRPQGVGHAAAFLLGFLTLEALLVVARHLGVTDRLAARKKATLVAALAGRLADRELVRRLAGVAPDRASQVLEAVRAAGGQVSRNELSRVATAGATCWWSWRQDARASPDGLPWLMCRGLVLTVDSGADADLVLPAEVEHALRGRLFAGWAARPPRLDVTALPATRPPGEVVVAAEALLDAWRLDPPELLKQGGLPARAARRTVSALGVREDEAHLLHWLVVGAGLAGVAQEPARRLLAPTREAERWRGLPAAGRWSPLFEAWLTERVGPGDGMPAGWLLLRLLADLPAGQGARMESLARALAWRHPSRFAGTEAAAELADRLGAELAFLGAGTAAPVVGLTALGRAAVAGSGDHALAAAFPASVEERTRSAAGAGRLLAGRAGFYVRGDDPAALAEVVASRRLRALSPRLVAPTVALLEAESLDHLVRELRRAGLMPATEGAAVGQPVRTPRRSRRPRERELDRAGAARLAARLAGHAAEPGAAPTGQPEERTGKVVELAFDRDGGIIEVDFAARRR